MTRNAKVLVSGSIVVVAIGCGAQVANLGGKSDAGTGGGQDAASSTTGTADAAADSSPFGLPPPAIPEGALVSTLSVEGVFQVLNPTVPPPEGEGNAPPGYAAGNTFGLDGCGPVQIGWGMLSPSDCVSNLRATGLCAATVGSVVGCANAFLNPGTGPTPAPCDVTGACGVFLTNPSCAQTVFQAGDAGACTGMLPIEMDASCGPVPSPAPALPPGVAASDVLANLTVAQDDSLCQWLVEVAGGGTVAQSPPGLPPGYVAGSGTICAGSGGCDGGFYFSLVTLPQTYCVENLQHSACEATMGDLAQCIQAFVSGEACSGSCACGPYMNAPGCSQTVIEAFDAGVCNGALPITADAACPQ
jgi:hypothetical protein